MRTELQTSDHRVSGLVDVLDRVLDKGLAIAGDITISLAEVELLTIRIRLIICSIDKAQEIGLDWWKHDRHLSGRQDAVETHDLQRQLRVLERKVAALSTGRVAAPRRRPGRRTKPGNEESSQGG